jgi:membrane associated rhomboid family serine protease
MVFTPLHDRNPLKIIPFQRVTLGIIALCCIVFMGQRLLPIETVDLTRNLGLVPAAFLHNAQISPQGSLIPTKLTVLTAAFLHGGWLHRN